MISFASTDFLFKDMQKTLAFLEHALTDSLEKAFHTTPAKPSHPLFQALQDSVRYSLLSTGKRLRPRAFLACSKMLQLPLESILPAALGLEMFHCFTLIHDDLPCMDNDDFRRGLPSNHKKFGESLALLAGDSLLSLAIEVFLETKGLSCSQLHFGLKRFLKSIGPLGVIGGQAAELTLAKAPSLEHLIEVHQKKTGALFEAALLIPMDFAGIHDLQPEGLLLQKFASAFGFAFQVADDLEEYPNAPEPKSILYYLTIDQAKQKALLPFAPLLTLLKKNWGDASTDLIHIAQEVIAKIERSTGD